LALFRLVNANVLGAIWFLIVAGKPHMSATLFGVAPGKFNKLAASAPLTNIPNLRHAKLQRSPQG
jgi:hypothetical protein